MIPFAVVGTLLWVLIVVLVVVLIVAALRRL
jgi:hypothetical protein